MRSRNIKPGFFDNESLGDLNPLSRLLFIGLWCYADREGRFEWRPKHFKLKILPFDNCEIEILLQSLIDSGHLKKYCVDGKFYGFIPKFLKHQNPHKKEQESELPEMPGYTDENQKPQPKPGLYRGETGTSTEQDTTQAGSCPADSGFLIPDILIPDSLIQGEGVNPTPTPDSNPNPDIGRNSVLQNETELPNILEAIGNDSTGVTQVESAYDTSETKIESNRAGSVEISGVNEPKLNQKKQGKPKFIPPDFGISDRVRLWADKNGHDRLDERLQHFLGWVNRAANSGKPKRYVVWDDVFMDAIREDWAKLNDRPIFGANGQRSPYVHPPPQKPKQPSFFQSMNPEDWAKP